MDPRAQLLTSAPSMPTDWSLVSLILTQPNLPLFSPYGLFSFSFFFYNKFVYFWLRWVFVAVHGFLKLRRGERGLLFIMVRGLLVAVASLVA